MVNRFRREPVQLPPISAGQCDWCGGEIKPPSTNYCSPACRTKYGNVLIKQGKQIIQAAKHWRKHRGRKGTNGQGMMQIISDKVDDFNREDTARKTAFKIIEKRKSK